MYELKDNVIPLPGKLTCMSCGAKATVSCGCNAPYVTAGERALAAIEETPHLSNLSIAKRIGVDEVTVRRARKRSRSADAEHEKRLDSIGRLQPAHRKRRKPAVKLFKARKVRGYKAPTNEKEMLIAFTRELATFCMHFGIELRNWLDTDPVMEPAGRVSLSHTLEAFSMELQMLSQRVFDGGNTNEETP